MSRTVTESIFSGSSVVVPLADVQHIEKRHHNSIPGIMVITRNTRWDFDRDEWSNAIWISEPEASAFAQAWCRYRGELEADTLMDLSPNGAKLASELMEGFDKAIAALKAAGETDHG
ncbi:hypothetical protein ACSVBT_12825 [Afipia sp. TerB]